MYRDTSRDGAYSTQVYDGHQTAFTDANLISGLMYYYRVKATNYVGSSPFSLPAAGRPLAYWSPAPADSATTSDTTPLLDWSDLPGAVDYELQLASSAEELFASEAVPVSASQHQVNGALAMGERRFWRVRARYSDGFWGEWSQSWSFTVSWTDSLAPTPADQAVCDDTTPLLSWTPVAGASGYELQIADAEASVPYCVPLAVAEASYQTASAYSLGDRAYWRVRARNEDGVWGSWSGTWSFIVSWTDALSAWSPSDGGWTSDTTPRLSWSPVPGAIAYQMQTATSTGGVVAAESVQIFEPACQLTEPHALEETVYWRVRARNADGAWGPWSTTWSFYLCFYGNAITPTPADGASTSDTTPNLRWTPVSGAYGYDIQVSDSSEALTGSPIIALSGASIDVSRPAYQVPSAHELGDLYWRVRAKNEDGAAGPWSAAWRLTLAWSYSLTPAPADGSTTKDTTPELRWNWVTGASGFEIRIEDDLTALAAAAGIPWAWSNYQIVSALPLERAKLWQVRAKNGDGIWGPWGPVWSFTVSWPDVATNPSPASGDTTTDSTPTLYWGAVAGAVDSDYDLQFASSEAGLDGSSIVRTSRSYTVPTGLEPGTYFWRVRPRNTDGIVGAWNEPWSLVVAWNYTLTPSAPADGGTTNNPRQTLSWSMTSSSNIWNYQIQVAPSLAALPGSAMIDTNYYYNTPSGSPYTAGTWYWRVRIQNVDGFWSPWGPIWSFERIYNVGDTGPSGGTIIHAKAASSEGWRYLEAAFGSETSIAWLPWSGEAAVAGATSTAVGAGKANTDAIVASSGAGSYAAAFCDGLDYNGYQDWFLPSKDELSSLLRLCSWSSGSYWSSSEVDSATAWTLEYGSWNSSPWSKSNSYYVWPVRRF